jgi:ribosome-binding ATPase YchF (GTP1/OBG family)
MDERPLRRLELPEAERRVLRGFTFLTEKPQIIVLNLDESMASVDSAPWAANVFGKAESSGETAIGLYGRLEMDLAELDPEEAAEFTQGLDMNRPGRERLIASAYSSLGLISFFTCGPDEVKAWTLRDGDSAVDAAGAIHSDLARGFIRAQVVGYEDYEKCGCSYANCRDEGLLKVEGKEYGVRDGDIIEIRFNV